MGRKSCAADSNDECAASRRAQLAFVSNPFVPLVQMLDLIFGLAILTLRKKSNNLVFAARVLTTHVWPIIHNLSEAKIPS